MANRKRRPRAPQCSGHIDNGRGRRCRNHTWNRDQLCEDHKGQVLPPPPSQATRQSGPTRKPTRPRSTSGSQRRSGADSGSNRQWSRSSPRSSRRSSSRPPSGQVTTPPGGPSGTPERQRLDEAAALCADMMVNGLSDAIAERLTQHVSANTWERLVSGWSVRRCQSLAELARAMLWGRDILHEFAGQAAELITGLLGRSKVERTFAHELLDRLPLPVDQELTATARALQVTGVYLCFSHGWKLTECACFSDVIRDGGQSLMKLLTKEAMDLSEGDYAWLLRSAVPLSSKIEETAPGTQEQR